MPAKKSIAQGNAKPPQAGPHQDTKPDALSIPEPGDPPDRLVANALGHYTGPTDLKSLRARNYVLALQIGQRMGLGSESIRKLPNNGLGFLVDVPIEPLMAQGLEDPTRRWLWWLLFALSEFSTDQDRAAYMIEHQITPADYLERDGDTYVGGPPDLITVARGFLSSPVLSDRDFQALCQLVDSCRMARQLCPDPDGEALWRDGWYDGREARR